MMAAGRLAGQAGPDSPVYIIPNFHPASCGWLTDFSTERNYCANGYLAHLDRAGADPDYAYAMSEVNNLMAVMAFHPERIGELKQRIRERRAELANAFFLEPTINLSGGEALVKMGVEGLRWQREVMGVRPRLAWMIDVTGVHEQMGQIVSGLGLDGMVYTRDNPTTSSLHWLQSPDGSRALGISPGPYSDWSPIFSTRDRLSDAAIRSLAGDADAKAKRTPAGAPILVLGGAGDYAQPPVRREYPGEFLQQWKGALIEGALINQGSTRPIRFATPSVYLDAVLPGIRSGRIQLPTTLSGARLSWTSFWIENPEVKQRYRHAEHALQSAESLATVASLMANGRRPVRDVANGRRPVLSRAYGTAPVRYEYPAQPLYESWLQMLLNMDRNTLWGAAGGMVFENARSWDVCDRFDSVEKTSARTQTASLRSMLGAGSAVGLFNSLNWSRSDPFLIKLPPGKSLKGAVCQEAGGGQALCTMPLPSVGTAGVPLMSRPPVAAHTISVPSTIENAYYSAKVDPKTGALTSLKLKPSGRELLSAPVSVVAESAGDFHETPPRPNRKRLRDSSQSSAQITVREGPVATIVEARSGFYGGGKLRQTLRFYRSNPRIDFETEVEDIPGGTVVLAEFPLANDITEVRRGIPYGFSHGAWSRPNPELTGFADGIQAAIRWSHYTLVEGGGVALLDRGLPGRELNGRTPVLFLMNAQDNYMGYPCAWLNGKGTHRFSYALLAHEGDWNQARIPQHAWEFNSPPIVVMGVAESVPRSFLKTSGNVIVEAVRREAGEIELRMAECIGARGTAEVIVHLPHSNAELTNLVGGQRHLLNNGPRYRFGIRPQQIVTMRFKTTRPVEKVRPLLKWDSLVPASKLAALHRYSPLRVGHPPLATDIPVTARPRLPRDVEKSVSLCRPAEASQVYHGMTQFSAAMACDGDENTRWATDDGASQATLEVNLGRPRKICRAYLSEAYDRVRSFELQSERDGRWVTFARGTKIGPNLEMRFPPVETARVRLNILDAPGGPTLWEFMLFEPDNQPAHPKASKAARHIP